MLKSKHKLNRCGTSLSSDVPQNTIQKTEKKDLRIPNLFEENLLGLLRIVGRPLTS